MRLGQGFNSYTQQICVDDAVVVDDQRPENVVTNDGTTMRIMAQKNATPSAWTRQKEVIEAKPATAVLEENARRAKAEVALIEEALAEEADAAGEEPSEEAQEEAKSDDKAAQDEPTSEDQAAEVAEVEDESASVDEVVDANEAREKVGTSSATKEESVSKQPVTQTSTRSGTGAVQQPKGDDDDVPDPEETTETAAGSGKVSQPKGDDDDVPDPEGEVEKPAAAPKKVAKRASSSDRGRQQSSKTAAVPLDRAAIRASLTGKSKPDAAQAAKAEADQARREKEEAEILAEQRKYQKEIMVQQRQDEAERRKEEREEARSIRAEKRAWDAKRREDARQAIESAANLKATSLADLEKIRAQNQFVERFNGMTEQTQKYDFDPTAPRGPSQTVTYTSRFVDRLSDVLDDMSVSGSLSIKAGKVGGSGKGSFVDSDKFKESDLNFYISVKVVNQTINFKDALVFNPLRSVDENNFREVYGDSFISGFVEGGEFNAIVSMKILNKAKKTDIQAEAKVALTAGAVQIEAEANVGIARSNIETNTETTIQVFWSGGGHIKPMEQQWDVQSLMAAAARFPDLVADCPQRIYAILTKYDSLRSFIARKPASYTPLQYENAQIYTNTLLDAFVSYKSLYKRLGEQIFGVQGKTLEVIPWSDTEKLKVPTKSMAVVKMGTKDPVTGLFPYVELETNFEASVKGLSDARAAIRRQMARIVNEVDAIEKDPKLATDEEHDEPFQSPSAFEARIPQVQVPERLRVKSHPLSGRRIAAKQLSEKEVEDQLAEEERLAEGAPLFLVTDKLEVDEQEAFSAAVSDNPGLCGNFRVSSAFGDSQSGEWFNNLDFVKQDWKIRSIRTEIHNGALGYLAVAYNNGLVVEKGMSRDKTRIKKLDGFLPGERINAASIEYGKEVGDSKPEQILGLRLLTNRGRSLNARSLKTVPGENGTAVKDDFTYEKVHVHYLDGPYNSGTIKGFFGRSDDNSGKILRLGLIWGRVPEMSEDETHGQYVETADAVDGEDLALLQKEQIARNQTLQALQQKLDEAQKKVNEFEQIRERQGFGGAQSGAFFAGDKGWQHGENRNSMASIKFPRPYASPPKLLFGLNNFDVEGNRNRAVSLHSADIRGDGFNIQTMSFNGCFGYGIGCSWMALPNDLHLETGMLHSYNTPQSSFRDYTRHVFFSQSFPTPPKVLCWFQEFGVNNRDFMSLKVYPVDINCNSFHIKIDSWANREFTHARVQFLAYPSEEDGKRVKSGQSIITRGQPKQQNRAPFYGEPFKNTPSTFIAVHLMDFGCDRNNRFISSINAPNNRELEWGLNTWDDTNMHQAEATWIAIE